MAAVVKELVHNVVEANTQDLWQLSRFVWEHPELAMKEVQCHDWLADFLERRGFEVTRNYLLDTAFKAEFRPPCGAEGGPCIALLCEYDALPDIGQACGHNLIAESSVGAALAVKKAMETMGNIHGKLVVLGTPAEESLCGKEVLIQKGALKGIDAALMCHPSPVDILAASFSALQQIVVRFRGKAAHAGASPWEGLNALDAAVASYVNVGLLRQQMKTSARVHGVITEGGGSPNVIPEEAEMSYNVRAPSTAELVELTRRVEACFHAAAEATGCTAHIDKPALYMHVVHNSAMARTYRKHSHALGVTFLDDVGTSLVLSGASTDCGNVSHRVPTIHPVFGIGSAQGPANHTRGFADVANAAESQPPTLRAAKALALTVLDLLMDAELMREVQREFVTLQPDASLPQVVVLGTPAEESCGGKQLLVDKGALEGIDAAIMCHPGRRDVLRLAFTATQQMVIRFKGKAAHAAASPWEGLNALDAAVASYLNISLLRQQVKPTSKIQGIIVHGGTYPNIIPEESELKYHVRAPTTDELVDVVRRVENCFHGAAQATGCTVEIERGIVYKHVIQNAAIARTYRKHAQALGFEFQDADMAEQPPTGASTDCGNVSHCIPTAHPVYSLGSGARNHTRGFAEDANSEAAQEPTLRVSKALALTALDLLTDPELLDEAHKEFAAHGRTA